MKRLLSNLHSSCYNGSSHSYSKCCTFILFLVCTFAFSVSANTSGYKIVVKKSERKLYLYRNDTLAKTYKIALGLKPIGSKQIQGDYKTPEGEYLICSKNKNSQFYRSLAISYPNLTDAERGLRDKIITKSEYEKIKNATVKHLKPPMNTKLGGDIFIHGMGTARDWTWGCIALENNDMDELFLNLPLQTPVTITP